MIKSVFISFIFCAALVPYTYAQQRSAAKPKEDINKLDARGKRHGTWLHSQSGGMGESGFSEFGLYEHGVKTGVWYKVDGEGDVLAIETFRNSVLDGEVKYYDKGKLTSIGYYIGLNPSQPYDTFYVIDPVTDAEVVRVIPTERRTMRHGMWRFYDPENGRLVREEDYQVDEMIYHKDYELSKEDSTYYAKRQMRLPHTKKRSYTPPPAKKTSYIN